MLKSPRISFSAAKESYHQHDQVQRKVDESLKNMTFQYLNQSRSTAHVLELGCGDGVSSIDMAKRLMPLSYDAVDVADVLINKAKASQSDHLPVSKCVFNFIRDDFDQQQFWQSLTPKTYDIIYSNMALQWSSCLLTLLRRIDQVLTINGVFAFSIPLNGTFDELKEIARINEFKTHHEMQSFLDAFGWQCLGVDKQNIQLNFSNPIEQLKHLKSTGVNSYLGGEKPKIKPLWQYMHKNNNKPTTLNYEIGLYVIIKR